MELLATFIGSELQQWWWKWAGGWVENAHLQPKLCPFSSPREQGMDSCAA